MKLNTQMSRENIAGGFAGALIGAAVGATAILLLDRLGIIASLSGLIMAFATLRGYARGAGSLSHRGIVICVLVMLAAVYIAVRAAWTMIFLRTLNQVGYTADFFDVFSMIEKYMLENGQISEYLQKYLFTYMFTFIGAVPVIKKGSESLADSDRGDTRSAAENEFTDEDGFHLYLPNPSWCRGYEISAPAAAGIQFAGVFFLGSLKVKETDILQGILVMILMAAFFILFFIGLKSADRDKEKDLAIIRTEDGELWCMYEGDLDGYQDYRFNGYPFGVPAFSSRELYERMKLSAKNMIEAAREGDREAFRTYRMMPRQMNRIRLEKEKITVWKIVYTDQTNQNHELKLPKIYKDLRIPGSDYCPQGPIRDYRFLTVAVGICLVVVLVGLIFIR